jgi:hypothetical protein
MIAESGSGAPCGVGHALIKRFQLVPMRRWIQKRHCRRKRHAGSGKQLSGEAPVKKTKSWTFGSDMYCLQQYAALDKNTPTCVTWQHQLLEPICKE